VIAIALALGASVVYGVSDFLGGTRSRALPLLSVLVVSQASALVLILVLVALAGEAAPDRETVVYGALAGVAQAVGMAALYRGLAVGTMGIVAPVAATAAVLPVLVAIATGEEPSLLQGCGFALALGGVIMISALQGGGGTGDARASVLFGLLAALALGGFLVSMDAASESSVLWALLAARVVTLTLFGAAMLAARARVEVPRPELGAVALIGVLLVGADGMFALASTQGDLGAVAVLSSLYPVVTIALARVYLGERITRPQLLGAVLVLAGVAAISA
jgi:drug/metabolite transporter (DMT)-like permease